MRAPQGWEWTRLTEVARLETGHTPSRRHPEYWNGHIPWIGIRDATENHGRIISDTEQHVTQEGINNSSARVLPAHTVCLSRTASIGFVVVMSRPMATSQDFVNWVCGPRLDWRFLKYVLLAERHSYAQFASGTTHQTIYFPEVKAFHICLPPLPTQRRIANMLGSLDDKLELNRRLAERLDVLSRETYRHAFVDNTTEDRRNSTLGDEFDVTMGQSPPGETYNTEGFGIPFYQGRVDFGSRYPARRVYCSAPTRLARAGDTLLSVRAPVGDTNIATEDCAIGRGVAAIRHREGYANYTFETLRFVRPQLEVFNGEGTVFGSVGGAELRALRVPQPDNDQVAAYETRAQPIGARLRNIERQNTALADLRDVLLPILLSGRVEGIA